VLTPAIALAAWVGVMVVLAALLTVACRRWMDPPPPPAKRPRFRRATALPPDPTAGHVLSRRAPWPRRPPGPVARCRPVQAVAADLRRLSRELAAVPAGVPFVRWQALQSAYDRVLVEAAEQLEVPQTLDDFPVGGARDVERLRVVCALEAAGLVVQG
jgi:hypothetical protein